jgi:hypothetical protein
MWEKKSATSTMTMVLDGFGQGMDFIWSSLGGDHNNSEFAQSEPPIIILYVSKRGNSWSYDLFG